jgi:O-acetyl-ADP-ribose deacetylase (regulator of RNase III)
MYIIHYTVGDATLPQGDVSKPRIIAHVCNDRGGWGKGFVVALSQRYPEAERQYRAWYASRKSNDFALGATQFVPVAQNLYVANIIGQHGYRTEGGLPPVRYEAIRQGLQAIANYSKTLGVDTTVHMPRIGCGFAGGDWEVVSAIITETLGAANIPVTVYDLTAPPASPRAAS